MYHDPCNREKFCLVASKKKKKELNTIDYNFLFVYNIDTRERVTSKLNCSENEIFSLLDP